MTRVLPADVFDALEFSALASGGIAPFHRFDSKRNPGCYVGHLAYAGIVPNSPSLLEYGGIHACDSDNAVCKVLNRPDDAPDTDPANLPRIPFSDWCKELGVIRGEE